MKTIGVVTPVFNQHFYTTRFLKSLRSQVLNDIELKVVVVDNNSDDKASVALSEFSDFVHFIRNDENLGFAKACNQGIKYLEEQVTEGILITNNDMMLDPNCIQELYKCSLSDTKIGIVGGKLRFPDGSLQHAGAFLSCLGWGQHKQSSIDEKYEEEEYVTGALFYIKKEVISLLGGFNENYSPAYFEEVRYCYDARTLDYITVYSPFATAIHYENITGKKIYGNAENLKKELSDKNQIKFYLEQEEVKYTPTSDKQLLISCKIYGNWSFSEVMRNLAKGLKRNGVDVSIAPQEYHEDYQNMPDWEIKEMINKPNDYWNRYVLRSSEGDQMYLMPCGKKRIAHTTGESTRINSNWRDQLNHTDLVLTTSSFFKNVLEGSGVTTPVKVLHNSYNPEVFNLASSSFKVDNLARMNFLSVFHFGERKSPDLLVRSFIEEFSPSDDVTLHIHSPSMEYSLRYQGISIKQWIDSIANRKPHAPITISSNYISDEALSKFMRNFQVFVLPTKGEGFGLPILQASALEIPSIVTNYSGVLDIVDDNSGFLIDYTLKDIPLQYLPYFRNYIGGKWADPSLEHLKSLMRYCYNNPLVVKEKGKNARINSQKFTIDEVGKKALEVIFE